VSDDREGRCPCCDRPMPLRAEMHGLMVESEPWRVYWRGVAVFPSLQPMRIKYLYQMLRGGGRANYLTLIMLNGEGVNDEVMKVHVTHIRRWLRQHRLPFEIINNRAWGYELKFTGGDHE